MRVYAPLDDPKWKKLDQKASKKGISRAQLIINAIDSYLHRPEPSTDELDRVRIKLDQSQTEAANIKGEQEYAQYRVDIDLNLPNIVKL
jgi:hypothetical protein